MLTSVLVSASSALVLSRQSSDASRLELHQRGTCMGPGEHFTHNALRAPAYRKPYQTRAHQCFCLVHDKQPLETSTCPFQSCVLRTFWLRLEWLRLIVTPATRVFVKSTPVLDRGAKQTRLHGNRPPEGRLQHAPPKNRQQ